MKTKLFDIPLQSPFIVGSGPLSYSAEGMIRLHEAGAGAVVTKTIRSEAAYNPVRHMVKCDNNTLINCEKWSDFDAERWINGELKKAADAGVVCIASVGHTVEESSQYVEKLEEQGASIIEVVSYDKDTMVPMILDAKKRVKIPVVAKLSPNVPDFMEMAKACKEAGADGFTACDSIGPTLKIDIETGKSVLDGASGYGWLTGSMIRPIILQKVCELRKAFPDMPIIGLGGVTKWQDGVEMIMAGANYIGVCSTVIMNGYPVIQKMNQAIDSFMESHGYQSYDDMSGIVISTLPNEDLHDGFSMGFDKEKCKYCDKCIQVCPYVARKFDEDGNMEIWKEECRQCGLCISMCPTGAIYYC